jgi:hypothetical protein
MFHLKVDPRDTAGSADLFSPFLILAGQASRDAQKSEFFASPDFSPARDGTAQGEATATIPVSSALSVAHRQHPQQCNHLDSSVTHHRTPICTT